MRRAGGAWAAMLVCVAATGCLTRSDGPLALLRSGRNTERVSARPSGSTPPQPAAGLYVESVLLERPIGDALLDRDLWVSEAAQLPPQTQVLLTENGLRVAVLAGVLPPAFRKALESEADTVNPHRVTFAGRKDAVLPTAGPIASCEYELLSDLGGERSSVKLQQAHGGMLVRPQRAADGRVRVYLEPQVQHGDRREWIRPSSDGTGFTVQGEVPLEHYPTLGFEVVLGPDDYLLIGCPADAANSLGSALFTVEVNSRPRQRVLVVRARDSSGIPMDLPALPRPRGGSAIAAEAAKW